MYMKLYDDTSVLVVSTFCSPLTGTQGDETGWHSYSAERARQANCHIPRGPELLCISPDNSGNES